MTQRRFLILLFALAAGTRLFAAYWHYQDMNIDEVVSAYEAFSLAETGRDRTGAIWPLYFLNFGFGENVTYAYLLVPLFTFFGAQSFLTPIPSVVFNTLAVMMFYLWTRRMFSDSVARTASVLLAISPWHLLLTSYEYNVSLIPFLLFTGLWGFFVGIQDKKTWGFLVTMSCFVLAMYTYGIAMMLIPFELLTLLWFFRSELRFARSAVVIVFLLGFVLIAPLLIFMAMPESGNVSLWSGSFPVLHWTRAGMFITPDAPLGLALLQMLQNVTDIVSLRPLFWNLDFVIAPKNLGLFWPWELPLILVGLVFIFLRKTKGHWRFIVAWSVLAIAPSLLMANEFHPHPWRLIFLLGVGELIAAVGFIALKNLMTHQRSRSIFSVAFVMMTLGSMGWWLYRFTDPLPLGVYTFRQGGITSMMELIQKHSADVDRVVMDDQLLRSYFFYPDVLWYQRRDPSEFQEMFQEIEDPEPGYFVPRIGKTVFCYIERGCDIETMYRQDPSGLFVVWGDTLKMIDAVEEIRHPDGAVLFRMLKD